MNYWLSLVNPTDTKFQHRVLATSYYSCSDLHHPKRSYFYRGPRTSMNTTSSLLSSWVLLLLHNQPIYVYGGSTCSLHVSWDPQFCLSFLRKMERKKYCFSLRMHLELYESCQYQLIDNVWQNILHNFRVFFWRISWF